MKDKEKQIEEMADIIFNSKYKNDYISPLKGANELYNAGYRKLPEDSVVLSTGEYKMLLKEARKAKNQCIKIELETIMKAEEKASKETAEKFYKKIYKKWERDMVTIEDVKRIAKSLGAEIKE